MRHESGDRSLGRRALGTPPAAPATPPFACIMTNVDGLRHTILQGGSHVSAMTEPAESRNSAAPPSTRMLGPRLIADPAREM